MSRGPVCPGEVRQWTEAGGMLIAMDAVFPRGTRLLVLYRACGPNDDMTRVGLLPMGTCGVQVVNLVDATSMTTRFKSPSTRERARGAA